MNEFKSPLIGKPGTSSSALLAPVRTEVAGGFKQTILNCLKNWCCCCCPCVKSERYDEATDAVTVDPLMVVPAKKPSIDIDITGFTLADRKLYPPWATSNPEVIPSVINEHTIEVRIYVIPEFTGRDSTNSDIEIREEEAFGVSQGDFIEQLGVNPSHNATEMTKKVIRPTADMVGLDIDLKKPHSDGSIYWDIHTVFLDSTGRELKTQIIRQQFDLQNMQLKIWKGGKLLIPEIDLKKYHK